MEEKDGRSFKETKLSVSVDNGRLPGVSGDEEVHYFDKKYGEEGPNMVMRTNGGPTAIIEP